MNLAGIHDKSNLPVFDQAFGCFKAVILAVLLGMETESPALHADQYRGIPLNNWVLTRITTVTIA